MFDPHLCLNVIFYNLSIFYHFNKRKLKKLFNHIFEVYKIYTTHDLDQNLQNFVAHVFC